MTNSRFENDCLVRVVKSYFHVLKFQDLNPIHSVCQKQSHGSIRKRNYFHFIGR